MSDTSSIYRVDKFVVPDQARDEFLQRVRDTHLILRRQPGFVRDAVLEQIAGPGKFNIVTIAEWSSQEAVDAAREVVAVEHARSGFDARATVARLGIEADIANYRPVAT